jgi:hypothetical protein
MTADSANIRTRADTEKAGLKPRCVIRNFSGGRSAEEIVRAIVRAHLD